MEKNFKQQGIATFESMSISKSKVVTVTFKLRYDEMLTSINLLQGLNTDITIQAKLVDRKPMNLGIFTVGAINFDRDGNAKIPFKSMVDSVELDNLCQLVDEEYIQLRFLAVLQIETNNEE